MARLAIVGAGWAGLAAGVQAIRAGHAVSVFEMAPVPGGRARSVRHDGEVLDNGQHILIGAYVSSLALMREVGVDPDRVLHRQPLALVDTRGDGLVLRAGPARLAFARALLGHPSWSWSERLSLVRAGLAWGWSGFEAAPSTTVQALCRALAPAVTRELVEPLCIAALNTPASEASAQVFLKVLRDGLFGERGCADLLLPRVSLGELFPQPAWRWLQRHGARLHARTRVSSVDREAGGAWLVCGERFDGVILACSAREASRLARSHAPDWASSVSDLRHEAIATVVLDCPGARLAAAMVSLSDGPAQFAFDQGALGARPGRFTFVVSGAAPWLESGSDALAQAVLEQARMAFPAGTWPTPPVLRACITERRATFACVAGLRRPPQRVAAGLAAAGDYVQGPYPATLEGAVRSGLEAAGCMGSTS